MRIRAPRDLLTVIGISAVLIGPGQLLADCGGGLDSACDPTVCMDGRDNDNDGSIDCEDLDCATFCPDNCGNGVCEPASRESTCDCEIDCGRRRAEEGARGSCFNGIDDDCNGVFDCKDPGCASDPGCGTPSSGAETKKKAPEPHEGTPLTLASTLIESVNAGTGELEYSREDIILPLMWNEPFGLPFRTYYKSRSASRGPLGYGWDSNLFLRLEHLPNGILLFHTEDGESVRFWNTKGGGWKRLGTTKWSIASIRGGYIAEDEAGRSCRFTGTGLPERCHDSTGNEILFRFVHGRLVEMLGRNGRTVELYYNLDGFLEGVGTDDGREIRLAYDEDDHLIETRVLDLDGRPTGETVQYRYSWGSKDEDLNHNLVDVTSTFEGRAEQRVLHRHYIYGWNGLQHDRVRELSILDAKRGSVKERVISFSYELATATGSTQGRTVSWVERLGDGLIAISVDDRGGVLGAWRLPPRAQ